MSKRPVAMIGRVFGMLTVICEAARTVPNQPKFTCRCKCGELVVRIGGALRYSVARGHRPSCGCTKQRPGSVARESPRPDRRNRGRVTVANYRDVARGFTPEQVKRLAVILRRHEKATCAFCARRAACYVAAEAVEAVLLEGEERPAAGRGDELHYQIDYRRQSMYV